MRILIAEDEPISQRVLQATLEKAGYEVHVARDGDEAWHILEQPEAPRLAILDWMMPGKDGVEICRLARKRPATRSMYIILLTAKGSQEDIVLGLEAGANDYIVKPGSRPEIIARVGVGVRVVQLQEELAARVEELEQALAEVHTLREILPICSYCKRIRDDQNYWQQVDHYISQHSDTQFSHSICPDCFEKYVRPELEQLERAKSKRAKAPMDEPVGEA